ncbi:hypothetical protein HGRIS_004534 [Hohenbuehelia grisea]|uniref:TPR-like protein n=1 Tax=Hohenbuehelia grisea TaxID=104357 RepID=A0ABR3JC59_9AGAR
MSTSTMPITNEEKIQTAKTKKDLGDQAFKTGDTRAALKSYHEALMYLLGLDKNAMAASMGGSSAPPIGSEQPEKPKTEADEIIEKIYANMSACHLKHENWKRTVETADKVLAKNPNHYKARFRKGKALGEQGFFEKALKVLEDLKSKNSEDTAIVNAEIARLRAIDNERERAHRQKLKGFLTRDKGEKKVAAEETSASA